MASHRVNGITIEIESLGKPHDPALLLLRGLGTQLAQWPSALLDALTEADFRVVLFDNRDVGLSHKLDEVGAPDLAAILAGRVQPAYRLADMADDAVGVLDALGIEQAHIAGISMGGMIVQHVAAAHGDRCLSMTSIMSSSGAPGLPPAEPEAMAALMSQPEDPSNRECVIEHSTATQRVIGSPAYPMSDAELRRYCEIAYDRCYHPEGVARQMAAVVSDGSRVELLQQIRVQSLVIHGAQDPLIPLSGGEDTARHIAGCRLEVIEGMGHDVTNANAPLLASRLIDHARRAVSV